MIAMIDIRHEQIFQASEAIKKKTGTCKILPRARFDIIDGQNQFRFDGLVCDDRMGGAQTGVAAQYCENCVLKKPKKKK